MLVLTRRNGESFYVSRDIRFRVLSVRGNQVRIGVNAPDGLPVYREEVREMYESDDAPRIAVVGSPAVAAMDAEGLEVSDGRPD